MLGSMSTTLSAHFLLRCAPPYIPPALTTQPQYRAAFWPTPDQIVRPPTSKTDIQAELDRIKTSRSLARQATVSSSTAELEAGRAAVEEEREKTMEDKRGLTPREWRRSQGLEDGVLTQGGVLGKWV